MDVLAKVDTIVLKRVARTLASYGRGWSPKPESLISEKATQLAIE